MAVVEGSLGGTYAKMGDFERAEVHLLSNIALNDRPGFSIEDSQTAKLKLVRLYINRNFPGRLPKFSMNWKLACGMVAEKISPIRNNVFQIRTAKQISARQNALSSTNNNQVI